MRPLNRPMFRYGGPIKQGIMSGIREPKRGGGSMGNLVGSPLYPKTKGREHHAAVAAIPWLIQAGRFLARPLVKYGQNVLKRAPTVGKGGEKLLTAPGQSAKFTPLQQVWDPNKAVPTGLGKYLMRSPEGRLLTGGAGWAGAIGKKGIAAAKWAGKSPLTMGGLIWGGYQWLKPDGSPANENEIANAKASTGGPPGGGDPGMQGTGEWFAEQAQKEANIAKQKEWDNRIKRYRDIMDIKGMNKEAAYKSLVDASKLIQESQDFKGDIKSGKLINQVIQAASKQFDKPAKTSDAINTLILQNELKKDLEAETNADKKLLLKKQIQVADKTLQGATFSEVITDRIKRGEVPTGNTLATILRATEGIDAKVIPSSKLGEGEDPISFLTKQVAQAKEDGTFQPGAVVISSRVLIVDEAGNIKPFL